MSSLRSNNVIEIDDDNDQAAHNSQRAKVPFNGVSPVSYPKLHSLLQKHQETQAKTDLEKKIAEESSFRQLVMKNQKNQDEVSNVVHILPSIDLPQLGKILVKSTPQVSNPVNEPVNEENKMEETLENELLVIQENFEPIVQISQTLNYTIEPQIDNCPIHQENPVLVNEEAIVASQLELPHQETENQVILPVVEEQAKVHEMKESIINEIQVQQHQNHEEKSPFQQQNANILFNVQPQEEVVNIESQKLPIQQDSAGLIGQLQVIAPEMVEALELSPTKIQEKRLETIQEQHSINIEFQEIEKQSAPVLQIQEMGQDNPIGSEGNEPPVVQTANSQDEPEKQYDIELIKSQILQILPDWSDSIKTICDKQIIQIYKAVKAQMDDNIIQQCIRQNQSQKKLNQKAIQIEKVDEKLKAPIDKAVIQKRSEPKAPFAINLDEQVPVPVQNQKGKGKPNEEGEDLHPFYALRKCNQTQLRAEMIQYFPEAKESLLVMNFIQLKELLNEALLEIEKQTKIAAQAAKLHQAKQTEIQKNHKVTIQPEISMPESQMRQYLINLAPSMRSKLQEIDSNYIRELYLGFRGYQITKEELLKKLGSYKKKQEETSTILNLCIQKFPQLTNELKKLTEEELRTIYKQFKNQLFVEQKPPSKPEANICTNSQTIKPHLDKAQSFQAPSVSQRPINHSPQPNLKRNYDTMMSTNPRKSDDNKSQPKRTKKLSSSELRARLITKLPNLKDNIMQLDDKQIEKIYKESIQSNQKQHNRRTSIEEEPKPVIILPDKKQTPIEVVNKPQSNREESKKQTLIDPSIGNRPEIIYENQNDKSKTHVYQLRQQKKRKSKTILLLHTEQLSEDEISSDNKNRMSSEGIPKKSSCECLQNTSISDLLKRLTDVIEKKT